jgi:hypothetical protein
MAKVEGNFLESKLPARAFATLTTKSRMAQPQFDELFRVWIRGLQAHNRVTLGWVKSQESDPRRHIHVALVAAAPLDCGHAATLWQAMVAPRYSEAASVEPYTRGLCGLGYVLKRLGSPNEESQFSDNLHAFALGSGESLFRTNSAQRRQVRRIKVQLNRRRSSAIA